MSPGRVVALLVVLLLGAGVAVTLLLGEDDQEPASATAARPTPRAQAAPAPEASLNDHLTALQRIASANGGRAPRARRRHRDRRVHRRSPARHGPARQHQRVRFPFYEQRAAPRVTRLDGGARRLRAPRDVRTMQYSPPGDVTAAVRAIAVRPGAASSSGCDPGSLSALRRGRSPCCNAARAPCGARRSTPSGPGRRRPDPQRRAPRTHGDVRRLAAAARPARARAGPEQRRGRRPARAARPRLRVVVRTVSETRSTSNVIAETGAVTPGASSWRAPTSIGRRGPRPQRQRQRGVGRAGGRRRPRRRRRAAPEGTQLRFGFWGAEELGLYGCATTSGGWTRASGVPMRPTSTSTWSAPSTARAASTRVATRSSRIERLLRRALGGRIRPSSSAEPRPRAVRRAGIPVGGLFTGTDRCYHRRCDTAANVDRELLTEMTRAARVALRDLARG